MSHLARGAMFAALAVLLAAAASARVASGPDPRPAEHQGACYCRASGELHCVGGLTRAACDKQCADALCDDWFWMERLACWNWGYGG